MCGTPAASSCAVSASVTGPGAISSVASNNDDAAVDRRSLLRRCAETFEAMDAVSVTGPGPPKSSAESCVLSGCGVEKLDCVGRRCVV